ncbi:LPPG:FO 2-phospho-L-lactate transferase [Methanococcoides vulcani]|uniref:2-phospho-L-lactate transferase n=1 Tax=Methanococcoides vulcani TaxID=1353158 RepID=A0A1H9Y4C4_9EURY|nr:2-phospho-L-lactate transferase [Methanococcoides vulcani]SES63682.1 LPPG:FO 2-phospho-L-lactate transferase [Methanococcoides vulcani]
MIVLSGGTGTPKLLDGLRHVLPEEDITVVVNTAEDLWVSGNLITPDIDTVLYLLSDRIDKEKWWGVRNDTFSTHEAMKLAGHDEGMMIGDLDRATHIMRSELLRQDLSLTEAIRKMTSSFGIRSRILPMSDDPVSTMITTSSGRIHFQDFWVKQHGESDVSEVSQDGIEDASISPGVIEALEKEDEVLIGPSNPITSIGPIINLPGMRKILKEKKVVAVSPIIGREPISGPAGKLMSACGLDVSSAGVAECYNDILDAMVLDVRDEAAGDAIKDMGIEVFFKDTLMRSVDISKDLAESIIDIFNTI